MEVNPEVLETARVRSASEPRADRTRHPSWWSGQLSYAARKAFREWDARSAEARSIAAISPRKPDSVCPRWRVCGLQLHNADRLVVPDPAVNDANERGGMTLAAPRSWRAALLSWPIMLAAFLGPVAGASADEPARRRHDHRRERRRRLRVARRSRGRRQRRRRARPDRRRALERRGRGLRGPRVPVPRADHGQPERGRRRRDRLGGGLRRQPGLLGRLGG